MTNQLKGSAILLVCLGVLFSIPIVAKTWSAHGAIPALITGLLVIVSVFVGPLSLAVAGLIEKGFFAATTIATDLEILLISILGVALFLAWATSLVRGRGNSIPYLPLTGWAILGAYSCVSLVLTHIT